MKQQNTNKAVVTARGRALHTVDWFLHGKPVLSNHDQLPLVLRSAFAR